MVNITPPRVEKHFELIDEFLENEELGLEEDLALDQEIAAAFPGYDTPDLDFDLDDQPLAPGFLRDSKAPDLQLDPINIFEQHPAPGEKIEDDWHSPLYDPEEYEPEEYRHALVA